MFKKILFYVSKIIFGSQYLDGYVTEDEKQEETPQFVPSSLFPNEVSKQIVTNFLKNKGRQ